MLWGSRSYSVRKTRPVRCRQAEHTRKYWRSSTRARALLSGWSSWSGPASMTDSGRVLDGFGLGAQHGAAHRQVSRTADRRAARQRWRRAVHHRTTMRPAAVRTEMTRRWRSRCRRQVQLFTLEIDAQPFDMAVKFGGLNESQINNKDQGRGGYRSTVTGRDGGVAGKTALKKCDGVTPAYAARIMLPLMVRPISLHLNARAINRHARVVLRRLEKDSLVQRRVKNFALRALSEIYKMDSAAGPKLRSMSSGERDHWQANRQVIVSALQRIGERGV